MHMWEVKNVEIGEKKGKKTEKKRGYSEKSLGKMVLVIRVVIKKFSKKMKKSLVE